MTEPIVISKVLIPITKSMIIEAKNSAALMQANIGMVANYGLDEPDRYYTGMLGEIVFKELLQRHDKKFDYSPKHDGTDTSDFIVTLVSGKVIDVDVKTCSKPHYKFMVYPTSQYQRFSYPVYVGIRLNGDIAEVIGYCFRKDLVPIEGMKVPSVGIRLSELKPIDIMLDKIAGV